MFRFRYIWLFLGFVLCLFNLFPFPWILLLFLVLCFVDISILIWVFFVCFNLIAVYLFSWNFGKKMALLDCDSMFLNSFLVVELLKLFEIGSNFEILSLELSIVLKFF